MVTVSALAVQKFFTKPLRKPHTKDILIKSDSEKVTLRADKTEGISAGVLKLIARWLEEKKVFGNYTVYHRSDANTFSRAVIYVGIDRDSQTLLLHLGAVIYAIGYLNNPQAIEEMLGKA